MCLLTQSEFDLTQRYLEFVQEQIARFGLSLSIHTDFIEWRRLHNAAPGVGNLSLALDPILNDIRESDRFWISFDTAAGDSIAFVGARYLKAEEDFIQEFVTTYLLWGNRSPRLTADPYGFVHAPPRLSGRIGYGGGSWVHPDWRGKNLAAWTSRLGNIFALRHFRADYYTCLIRTTMANWGETNLGWPNALHLTTGTHPGRGNVDMYFLWRSKDEILQFCSETRDLSNQDRALQGAA